MFCVPGLRRWQVAEDIGINKINNKNTNIILIDATMPNSLSISAPVSINAANPAAVVAFVTNVALPIFCTTRDNAFTLFP